MVVVTNIWTVWRKANQEYIHHYTDFDDIPDEYHKSDVYKINKTNCYGKISFDDKELS